MTNEATLESRIHVILKNLFPWLDENDITHQDYFSIKLGHGNLNVKSTKMGRSDVLVSCKGTPLILLELKSPTEEITDEDVKQGLSYARLTSKITPITVVSNSKKNRIINTYTGLDFDPSPFSKYSDFILHINGWLSTGDSCIDDAIDILTGGSAKTIALIFEQISNVKINLLTGKYNEMNLPYCREFSIMREISNRIFDHINEKTNQNYIILTGPAQIGKTNVAIQLAELLINDDSAVIFIEPISSQSIIKCIESAIYSEFKITLSEVAILQWIRHFVTKSQLIIIIDRATPDEFESFRAEILQFLDIIKGTESALVVVTDLITSEMEFKSPGRKSSSTITSRIKTFKLEPFNFKEYKDTLRYLSKNGISIDRNHVGTPEFRNPRILRSIIGSLPSLLKGETYVFVPGLITEILELSTHSDMLAVELTTNLRIFAKAFIEQITIIKNPELKLHSMEVGCVDELTLKKYLTVDQIQGLEHQGLVEIRSVDADLRLIYPRDPISFITAAAPELIKIFHEDIPFPDQYQKFIDTCNYFPSGDLLAIFTLKFLYKKDLSTFSNVINQIFKDKPKIHNLEDKKFEVLLKIDGRIANYSIDVGDVTNLNLNDSGVFMVTQFHQWRILSLLLSSEWFSSVIDIDSYIRMVYIIGSYEKTLFRMNVTNDSELRHTSHDVGKFEIACISHGVVEPISLAITRLLFNHPAKFLKLANYAITNHNFPFCNRLQIVLASITLATDDTCYNDLVVRVDTEFNRCLKILNGEIIQGRNEQCICQSGLKYKKCCGK